HKPEQQLVTFLLAHRAELPRLPLIKIPRLSLAEVLDEADAIAADATTLFGHLNAQQINWKPSANHWSVTQCLEHLITINREYYPQFDKIIKREKKTTLCQSMPVLPSLFGRMMVKALSPNFNQQLKAPEIARPSTSAIDPQIVNLFVEHQRDPNGL